MNIALDPGFGNTKVSTAVRCSVIQTAISRPKNIGKAAIGFGIVENRANLVKMDSGSEYLVGPGAWGYGNPLAAYDYLSLISEPRLAIYYAAISQCISQGEYDINKLVIGLPVPLLMNNEEAEETIQSLKTLKRLHEFTISNFPAGELRKYSIRINKISYLAQPVGAYADYLINDDLQLRGNAKKSEVAVIDLGMNTLDLYVVQAGKVEPRFVGGEKVGVRRLIDLINDKTHDVEEIDARLRDDPKNIPDPAINEWLLSVMSIIENTWPKLNRFDAVILSGGGCMVLGQRLAMELSRRGAVIHVPENPITTNVRGFYKWAAYQEK